MPPLAPVIDPTSPDTNIGNLYIGKEDGSIGGSGFSEIAGENKVCFEDGVCTFAESSTGSKITFKVPAGASSGGVTVEVRGQVSEPEEATVNLENTESGWLIRTMGYSKQSG